MNKDKTYVRNYPCSFCGENVIAKYDFDKMAWTRTCKCGCNIIFPTVWLDSKEIVEEQ